MSNDGRSIGVFDSGMGGLTVLRALRQRLPHESFIYLGDTARLPYGTKGVDTVRAYALQATRLLMRNDVKMIVVACNTASAAALPSLQAAFAPTPVIGVVEPGAEAALAASRSGRIAVIATESTVNDGAYRRAIRDRRPEAAVVECACSLFVALAEEGWSDGAVAGAVARQYLEPLFARADPPDTLLLGCTHFPVLLPAIREAVGAGVAIVDSAQTTAWAVAAALEARRIAASVGGRAGVRFLASDSPQRFARVGSLFLGAPIAADRVELVDV